MRTLLLIFVLSAGAWAQPNNITLRKEVPGWQPVAETPSFSPVAGEVDNPTTITISSLPCDAYIYHNTSGSVTSSDTHSTTASVTSAGTLYAKVIGCPNYRDSAEGSAAYTIAAGDTIGNDTIGANPVTWNSSITVAFKFVAPASGSNGNFGVYCLSDMPGTVPIGVGVYSDSSGSPATLLAETTINCTTSVGWREAPITMTWVNGTTYWLAVAPTDFVDFYRDAGGTAQEAYWSVAWGGTMPTPWGGGAGFENYTGSIRVIY